MVTSAPRPTIRPTFARPALAIMLRPDAEASKQLKPQRDETQKSTAFSTAGGSLVATHTHVSAHSTRSLRDPISFVPSSLI